jgi:hypothetical protein
LFDVMTGQRREFRTGHPRNSPASRKAYHAIVANWEAQGRRLSTSAPAASDITIAEGLSKYVEELERKCRRPDGTPAQTIADFKITSRLLREMFGREDLGAFSAEHLEAFRDRLIRDGRVCPQIAKRLAQCRQFLNWTITHDLFPIGVDAGRLMLKLKRVKPPSPGQFGAKAGKTVEPADPAAFDAALPFLPPVPRAVAALLRHSAAVFVRRVRQRGGVEGGGGQGREIGPGSR